MNTSSVKSTGGRLLHDAANRSELAAAMVRLGSGKKTTDSALLRLCSLIAASREFHDSAIAYLARAIVNSSRPLVSDLHNLGDLLLATERESEAIAAFLFALRLEPDRMGSYCGLGRTLHRAHWFREAAAVCRMGLQEHGRDPALLRELADIERSRGRRTEALTALQEGMALSPGDAAAHSRLGWLQLEAGSLPEALSSFVRGLGLRSKDTELLAGQAETLARSGERQSSIDVLLSALALDPADIRCLSQLLRQLGEDGTRHDAFATATFDLAAALRRQGRYAEAKLAYAHALALGAKRLDGLLGLAETCLGLAQPGEAVEHLESALSIEPRHALAHSRLGLALSLLGNNEQGWEELKWFYDPTNRPPREFGVPVWDGSPLNGRTILMWTDQGHGDSLMGLRHTRVAKRLGGRVVVECRHLGLVPLISRMPEVEAVASTVTALPSADVHVPLVSFPALIPAGRQLIEDDVPYLSPDDGLQRTWRKRLGAAPNHRAVGLSWAGNPSQPSARSRFVPLRLFKALADIPEIRLIGLQHGPQSAEALDPTKGFHVELLMDDTASIDDAAALIMNLDLVITVDTMIAHLAGALGRPVWTLLRYATNPYWRLKGESTAWYPTMRLFRQNAAGDWPEVISRVCMALRTHSWPRTPSQH